MVPVSASRVVRKRRHPTRGPTRNPSGLGRTRHLHHGQGRRSQQDATAPRGSFRILGARLRRSGERLVLVKYPGRCSEEGAGRHPHCVRDNGNASQC